MAQVPTALIPASRLTDWEPGVRVGVVGGIPNRTVTATVAGLSADAADRAANSMAIQAAIDAAVTGDCVLVPAGTWPYVGLTVKSGVTLRGAGMGVTTLAIYDNVGAIAIGTGLGSSWDAPAGNNTITAGLTKDSTVITIADASSFSVGNLCRIGFANYTDDAGIEAGGVLSFQDNGDSTPQRKQMVRIVSKTSTTLTLSHGIYHAPQVGATIYAASSVINAGVEDMTIECSNASIISAIDFEQCYNCWIKGVEIKHAVNYPIKFLDCLNCEIRRCFLNEGKDGAGSNGAGLIANDSAAFLLIDSIIYKCGPSVEINQGSCGWVAAYNLFEPGLSSDEAHTPIPATLNCNHGPHNSHGLIEGNIGPSIQSDGYFGPASEVTIHRNWIHGSNRDNSITNFIIGLNRFTRNFSLTGNILGFPAWPYGAAPYSFGNPNIGNSSSTGTAQPTTGDFWRDWKATGTLTTRTDDNSGVITMDGAYDIVSDQFRVYFMWSGGSGGELDCTNEHGTGYSWAPSVVSGSTITFTCAQTLPAQGTALLIYTGISGFQELDLDVEETTILRANYHMMSGSAGIPAGQELAGDTLPDSLFLTEKPDWWDDGGALTWPPFDPESPGTPSYTRIPAAARYLASLPPMAPTITSASAATVFGGEALSYQITTDVPADSYTVSGAPGTSAFDTSSGLFTWTPNETDVFDIVFTATNATGTSDDFEFTLTALGTRRATITCAIQGAVTPAVESGPFTITNEYDGHD